MELINEIILKFGKLTVKTFTGISRNYDLVLSLPVMNLKIINDIIINMFFASFFDNSSLVSAKF